MRDYLWDIKGPTNIYALVKSYFAENGYDFDSETGDDYEDGDDDWEDEDWGDEDEDEDW